VKKAIYCIDENLNSGNHGYIGITILIGLLEIKTTTIEKENISED
jgi:hypothetical protein